MRGFVVRAVVVGCTVLAFADQAAAQVPTLIADGQPGAPSSTPANVTIAGTKAYFSADATSTTGRELFVTDGTAAGTAMVAGTGGSDPDDIVPFGDRVFFTAGYPTSQRRLWIADGAVATNLGPAPTSKPVLVGATLYFGACPVTCGLWKSNGTAAGTVLVAGFSPRPTNFATLGTRAVFAANDGVNGDELWVTDGTWGGTYLVKNINPSGHSNPQAMVAVGDQVVFTANNGVNGFELWRTDGTSAGTSMVVDLLPGTASGVPAGTTLSAPGQGLVFFNGAAATSVAGAWVSDGTAAGTRSLPTAQALFPVQHGPWFYFYGTSPQEGAELWRTDLAATGASLFVDVSPGTASSAPTWFVPAGADLYFRAVTADAGAELWKTDGTAAGTQLVLDMVPGPTSGNPVFIQKLGKRLLFTAFYPGVGTELWALSINAGPVAQAGPDQRVEPGQSATLDGSGSSDADGDGLSYEWRDTNGVLLGSSATLGVTLPLGLHDLTLTVSDGEASASDMVRVRVGNRAPVANAGGPYAGYRNAPVVVDGSASTDQDGDPLTYTWTYGASGTASGASPTLTFGTLGSSVVTLVVSDGESTSEPVTATVAIANRAPVASAGGTYQGLRQQAVVFDGAASSDEDGDALTYAWTFGDGTTGSGVAPTHTYAGAGSYTVTLVVDDGTEASAAASTTVTIANRAPTAVAGGPYSGVLGTAVVFNGSGSSDPENDTLTFTWDFGDGASASGVSPGHTYAQRGTFQATLVVSDGSASSAPAEVVVVINNRPPTAHAGGPYSGTRMAPIVFDGTASADPDGDALTYAWNFGDGASGTGATPAHTYSSVGSFVVTVVVSDGQGGSHSATSTVAIANVGPAVTLQSPINGSVTAFPTPIQLSALATDPDGVVSLVAFFAGATKIGEAATAPYAMWWTPPAPGPYVLTAVVTDSSGATAVSTPASIVVNGAPAVAISTPAPGAIVPSGSALAIAANAVDPDGTVTQVEFFANGQSLGVDVTSPYGVTWSNPPSGRHVITAAARDNLGAVSLSAPVSVAVSASLPPTHDAYVRASQGNTNFGTASTLNVQQGSASSNQRWTYVKFDLSGMTSVTSAKLRVFGAVTSTTSAAIQMAAYPVASTTWTESALTWNSRPAPGTTALAVVPIVNTSTAQRWYELDVTAYVQAEMAAGRQVVSLVLRNLANSPIVSLQSDESTQTANRPRLLVVP